MVDKFSAAVILTAFALLSGISASKDLGTCKDGDARSGSLNLSIQSQRNKSGEWVTTFTTSRDSEDSANIIKLDINHTVVECGGKKLVQVHGTLRDTPARDDDTPAKNDGTPARKICHEDLRFHSTSHGKHIVVSDNGRKATRKNELSDWVYGTVITNRPLARDELFEVSILSNISYWSPNQFGIGVTSISPSSMEFPSKMDEQKTGTWMISNSDVYQNAEWKKAYGKNLRNLEAGTRVGLTIRSNNTMHILVNGIDHGPAIDKIPDTVYGFVDVLANTVSVSIIDNTCKLV